MMEILIVQRNKAFVVLILVHLLLLLINASDLLNSYDFVGDRLKRREATTTHPSFPEAANFYKIDLCSVNCNHYWINLRYSGDGTKQSRNGEQTLHSFVHRKLSSAYRMAAILDLKPFNFSFPFYGQPITDRVIIATGGFLHIGDVVDRSHLTESQYIAPLMANFDFSQDDSLPSRRLLYFINDSLLVVEWRNVSLQEYPDEPFTFQTQIYRNGTIVLAYYNVPIELNRISKIRHPVKAGISDGYFGEPYDSESSSSTKGSGEIDVSLRDLQMVPYLTVSVIPPSRLHAVTAFVLNFDNEKIPLLSCHSKTSCALCLPFSDDDQVRCAWCPAIGKCSNGYDQHRTAWLNLQCHQNNVTLIHKCPPKDADPPIYIDLISDKRFTPTLTASPTTIMFTPELSTNSSQVFEAIENSGTTVVATSKSISKHSMPLFTIAMVSLIALLINSRTLLFPE